MERFPAALPKRFTELVLTLQNSPEGPPKKSCNDDMILFIFHMNEDLTFSDFRKMAGRRLSRDVRCRYKTFFAAPSALFRDFYAASRLIPALLSC
jgi:hypothetical protein